MIFQYALACAAALLPGSGTPSFAQLSPALAYPSAAQDASAAERHPGSFVARRDPGLIHRLGHAFKRMLHPEPRWYAAPSRSEHCKSTPRNYDSRTNTYSPDSGLRRICVL